MIFKSINSSIHQIKFFSATSENPIHYDNSFYYRHDKKKRRNGFTLVELLFVIAIIGVLAAIAIPFLRSYLQRGYDSSAVNDLKNAYTAAQLYFSDHSSDIVDLPSLQQYGFRSTPKVKLDVVDGTEGGFNLTAFHEGSSKTYSIDSEGSVSSN